MKFRDANHISKQTKYMTTIIKSLINCYDDSMGVKQIIYFNSLFNILKTQLRSNKYVIFLLIYVFILNIR